VEQDFWRARWQHNQIGFHLAAVNPRLLTHHDVLPTETGTRVLVPLCGKSLDMVWLAARGFDVVGVELSELAVRDFFDEHSLSPTSEADGALVRYRAGNLTVYCGDFFKLGRKQLGDVAAFYDRAALVALPERQRVAYVAHLAQLLPAAAVGLLISFEYPPDQRSGPPFPVDQPALRALYEPAFAVQQLASYDILAQEPRYQAAGVTSLHETVYRLLRR
jgi:thiopurine S-methyltransferase